MGMTSQEINEKIAVMRGWVFSPPYRSGGVKSWHKENVWPLEITGAFPPDFYHSWEYAGPLLEEIKDKIDDIVQTTNKEWLIILKTTVGFINESFPAAICLAYLEVMK
jgi:hypothetical protein